MTKPEKSVVGRNVRLFRRARGLSQERLAERTGIDPSTLGKIERGRLSPKVVTLEVIAVALETSLARLVTDSSRSATSALRSTPLSTTGALRELKGLFRRASAHAREAMIDAVRLMADTSNR